VLSEVSQLKDRQEDTDSKLETMKMENEALWQEVSFSDKPDFVLYGLVRIWIAPVPVPVVI
jgi:hypothetical protein